MKINLAYIISHIDKALAFEWVAAHLNQEQFNLIFILMNPGESQLAHFLKEKNIKTYQIPYRSKRDLPKAIWKIRQILHREKVQIIHTHLFDAALAGLSAGKLLNIPQRINTRHHSSLHHIYFPRAVYYDRLINYLATDIIAISRNVKGILIEKEKVSPKKIHLVHHGFQLQDFDQVPPARVEALREKYQIKQQSPVIGVIARQTEWKGIQYIIPAFQSLLKDFPHALLLLANAKGDYKKEINHLLEAIPRENYLEIVFETDLFALYQLMDLYVHTPIDEHSEAFGQTYVEALAAGIPSVFTLSGVAAEFIKHGENALVVPFQDSVAIEANMRRLLGDSALRQKLRKRGQEEVKEQFSLAKMIQSLERIYSGRSLEYQFKSSV